MILTTHYKNLKAEELTEYWESLNFKEIRKNLEEIQVQIAEAAKKWDMLTVKRLQDKITKNHDFKCLAVNQVCETASMPGVDKVKWKTSEEKMLASFTLSPKGYKAMPLKYIKLETRNTGKTRYIGIPTYRDRAMSVLHSYGLIPYAEAVADSSSFGFRAGRSAHDAHAYLLNIIEKKDGPNYIVCADVKSFFATIRHNWLLEHIPMNKKVLKEFLASGYLVGDELFPSESYGISEGYNIAAYLSNLVLDGLQGYIYHGLYGKKKRTNIDYDDGSMTRFADDIIVTTKSRYNAERVMELIEEFLLTRGLAISQEKSYITTVRNGFTFLSRTYEKRKGCIYSYPSEEAVYAFSCDLHDYITTFTRSQRDLIKGINQKLYGWAGYHRYSDAEEAFRKVDAAVQASLLEKTMKLHPQLPKQKVIHRYWYELPNKKHVFALPEDKSVRVISLADVLIQRHRRLRVNFNPYTDKEYFEARTKNREIMNVTGRYKPIWKRQGGKCFYCGKKIIRDEPKTVVTLNLRARNSVGNNAYVHEACSESQFDILRIIEDVEILRPYDVEQTLLRLIAFDDENKVSNRVTDPNWKYAKLKLYFQQCPKSRLMLKFKEIEDILGFPLSDFTKTSRQPWYPRKDIAGMPYAWTSEGYKMKRLDMKRKTVTFELVERGVTSLEIPEILKDGKVPPDAKYELEKFMEYIIEKYGIHKDAL